MACRELGSSEAMSAADVEPSSSPNFAHRFLLEVIADETDLDVKNEQIA